jgi:phosphoribosylformylglycinamidine synthase
MDLHVPPTLAAFALAVGDAENALSPEFKKIGSKLVRLRMPCNESLLPDTDALKRAYASFFRLVKEKKILSASAIGKGGAAAAISKAALGNGIGAKIEDSDLYGRRYGELLFETEMSEAELTDALNGIDWDAIGYTWEEKAIEANGRKISLQDILIAWMPLESVFPSHHAVPDYFNPDTGDAGMAVKAAASSAAPYKGVRFAKPRIFMPIFPGTNCEYDSARAFEKAGGAVEALVVRNLTGAWLEETIEKMAEMIGRCQMIMIPGGFSAGDEPDGSGKFIAAMFRSPKIKEAVECLLKDRDGLVLGVCNGFQALIKLGLLQHGEIKGQLEDGATLAYNKIGRHVSCLARTKVVSNKSPWLWNTKPGDEFIIPISHGEGRFAASGELIRRFAENGQIATQYIGLDGLPTGDLRFNPNGSAFAVEGLSSPDGRVLGKMGHSERIGRHLYKNVPGERDQRIFEAGVGYYK